MWKPSAMTSPRRASSPSSASAGGQEEQPCEVKSSTTGGRVSAAAGDMTTSALSHNSAVTCAVRCNDTIPSGADDLEDGRATRNCRITSACGCQPSCRLRPDKAGEQAVDLARFFHLRQVAGLVEDVHRQATGERLGMGERDDAVVAAPDDLHRHFKMERDFGDPYALHAVRKPSDRVGCDGCQ